MRNQKSPHFVGVVGRRKSLNIKKKKKKTTAAAARHLGDMTLQFTS